MKRGIHPQMYEVELVLTNGQSIRIFAAYSKHKVVHLSDDMYKHAAWTGTYEVGRSRDSKVHNFKQKKRAYMSNLYSRDQTRILSLSDILVKQI